MAALSSGPRRAFFQAGRLESEIVGMPGEVPHPAGMHLGNARRAIERDFVEAVLAVDDDSPFDAQHRQRLGHERPQLRSADAQQLKRRAGRIRQRAEQVEDRGHAQLLTHVGHVLHRAVQQRRKAEADSQLVQAGFDERNVRPRC